MNLQHLEYLIEIENCGSISKAARRLFVTQPYLSRILKEVESEYGITVFTREKTGITPTDSGWLFLDMARDLLDNAGNFQRIFRERADHYRLRISACTCSHPNDAFIRMVKSIPDIPLRFSYRESSPASSLETYTPTGPTWESLCTWPTPAARSKSFCPSATWRSIFSSPPGPSSFAGRTTRS